jgi:hypothetical protein
LFLLSMRMETQVCVRAARAAARTMRMGRERHVCLSGRLSPKQSFRFRPNPVVDLYPIDSLKADLLRNRDAWKAAVEGEVLQSSGWKRG